jgi:hypothetical protein
MFRREEEPVLVFGEAKSFAAESFKPEDIARMRKVAELFPGASIVFATLKETPRKQTVSESTRRSERSSERRIALFPDVTSAFSKRQTNDRRTFYESNHD